jgi:hypothetical protein
MQVETGYGKEVYNGDIAWSPTSKFRLANSRHKSQGSE